MEKGLMSKISGESFSKAMEDLSEKLKNMHHLIRAIPGMSGVGR